MTFFRSIFVAIALLTASSVAQAQCGATWVGYNPTSPMSLCEGDTITVDFSASGTCVGNYEFQVNDGATVLQNWTTNITYDAFPTTSTLYTVYARCDACPNVVVSDTFSIWVTTEPTISGTDLLCLGDSTDLVASGSNGILSWWDDPNGGNQMSATGTMSTGPMSTTTTYYAQASNTVVSGGTGSILITECGLEGFLGSSSADYIEVSNLYSTPINTSGWVVAVSASYTNINSVNTILWNLPNSFAPCSMLSKTDVSSSANYWGNNIFWNATSQSWAIIIDDVGNVVDFIAWGWSAVDLANFNPTINGFSITLGPEWVGAGCPLPCQTVGGIPYSFSRTGSADNNVAGDFTCQATSLDVVNPGLSCGWTVSPVGCMYPHTIVVDQAPTASNPDPINVECIADVPAPNATVVDDELDDLTAVPLVMFMGEVSDGNTCPEVLTRTYRVSDSCNNYIDVTQTITINDITAPVFDPEPADITVECSFDVPAMIDLGWTDNCDGAGMVTGTDVSDGNSCPEIITRTWTYTDACGNVSSVSQTITVDDITPPVIQAPAPDLTVQCYGDVPAMVSLDWTDNCDGSGTLTGTEVSDGNSCPEVLTRTWTYTDACGNTTTVTRVIIVDDTTPPTASDLPPVQFAVLPAPDSTLVSDAADNCGTPTVTWVSDVSNGGLCPEIVVRTYSVIDDCDNEIFVTQEITVGDPFPDVSFIPSQTQFSNLDDATVHFTNTSTGAVSYIWDFGDASLFSNEINPTHSFPNDESAGYVVELVGYSEFGCTDTFTVVISIQEEVLYYIPNSFTPDGDEYNNTFQPVFTSGFDIYDFEMKIYNRWGELIFETHDATVGWDGTFNGKIVANDTYIWKIRYTREGTGDHEILTGYINLIK